MSGQVDILRIAEKFAPEVVYEALKEQQAELADLRQALEQIQRFIEGRHKEGDTEYQVAIVARVALAGSVAAPHTKPTT